MKCYDAYIQFDNELKKGKEGYRWLVNYLYQQKEVAKELEVSDSYAYRLIRQLNAELEQKGFVVVKGKISRKYFEERVYGMNEMK